MVSVPINRYDNLGKYIDTWESETMAAKKLNMSLSVINRVVKGSRKSCKGYIFKKANEYPAGKDLDIYIKTKEVLVVDINTNQIVSRHDDAAAATKELGLKSVLDVYKKCDKIIIYNKDYYLIRNSNNLKEEMECKWRKILKHSKRLRMYISQNDCKVRVMTYQTRGEACSKLNITRHALNKILKDPLNKENQFEIVEECRLVDFGYVKPIKCN